LWEQFAQVNNEIFKWSDGLTDDQLNWKPSGRDTNSIGILMSHIMGIEIFSVAERVGGQSVNRDRSAEFANRATRDALVQRRAEVEKLVRETFDQLTTADLTRTIRTPNGEVPVGKFLLNSLSHVSDHMGQVILTRKLLDGQK
jgi:DinB superfamily